MNVIRKLTLSSIRLNKKRSVATVIAIILSTALICGTAGLCASALKSFQQSAIYQVGDFHVTAEEIRREDTALITGNAKVKDFFFTKDLGYGVLEGSKNEDKPYVFVTALSARALNGGWGVHLVEGRLPQNETELLVGAHILTNGRVQIKVGDTLTLALGTRTDGAGNALTQDNSFDRETAESVADTKEYTYTVVGVMERPDREIEGFMAPGYSCFTFMSDEALAAADPVNVSFTLKNARDYDAVRASLEQNLSAYNRIFINRDLLEYSGALSEHTTRFILRVGAMVTVIIMLTSVFVIRNSFAISVSEKTRMYGILASVGATAAQIRKSVLYEGLLFGLVGVPVGIGSGILAIVVLLKVVNALMGDLISGLVFVYRMPPVFALISAVLAAVTIFFSAYIPARRAGKIPPIEAVRGNREVNVRKREVRVSGLTQKLFGMGGVIAAKNLKRSRKKYRTTVISLVLSVTVFISLSSFVGYLKKSVSIQYEKTAYNLAVTLPEKTENEAEIYASLVGAVSPESYAYYYTGSADCDLETYGSASYKLERRQQVEDLLNGIDFNNPDAPTEQEIRESMSRLPIIVAAYNAEYFAQYIASLGLTGDPAAAAVLCDLNGRSTLKAGDTFHIRLESLGFDLPDGEPRDSMDKDIVIGKVVTDSHAMGLEGLQAEGVLLFVSEAMFTGDTAAMLTPYPSALYLAAKDPNATETQLMEFIGADARLTGTYVFNVQTDVDQQNRVILIAEIFLYGFITVITLIGVTNIFNTVTTNMNLRQKEFAMLKSVGMTKREFNRMIRLESLLYGLKSLMIGVPLGVAGGAAFYTMFRDEFRLGYSFPLQAILLSALFVFVIVGLTMRYSMGKINKQNIIETIRNENV